jgi:type II secretory pathway pseudopilin PulG
MLWKKVAALVMLAFLATSCNGVIMSRTASPQPAPIVIQDNSGDVVAIVGIVIVALAVAIVVIGLPFLLRAGRDAGMENVARQLLDQQQQGYQGQIVDPQQHSLTQPGYYQPDQQQQYPPQIQQPSYSAWLNVQPKNPNQPIWYEGEVVQDVARQLRLHPADVIALLQQGQISLWTPDPPPNAPKLLGGRKNTGLQRRDR